MLENGQKMAEKRAEKIRKWTDFKGAKIIGIIGMALFKNAPPCAKILGNTFG